MCTVKRNFGKEVSNQSKLRIHNITAKTALRYGNETWVLNKRDNEDGCLLGHHQGESPR
jgi:hypothetical protein